MFDAAAVERVLMNLKLGRGWKEVLYTSGQTLNELA